MDSGYFSEAKPSLKYTFRDQKVNLLNIFMLLVVILHIYITYIKAI